MVSSPLLRLGGGVPVERGGRGLGSARGGGLGARTLAQQHDLERQALHPLHSFQPASPPRDNILVVPLLFYISTSTRAA